jgi:hypothetical protein
MYCTTDRRGPTRPLALHHSMFVVDPKRSRLTRHRPFQLLHLGPETLVAIIQILDLLLEFFDFLTQFINHARLAQNNFDQLIGFVPQQFQGWLEC